MKISYFLVIIFIAFNYSKAQTGSGKVGVNTNYPLQLFHVDALKNNKNFIPSPTEIADDVVITSAGNVGVGVVNPSSKLEISSGIENVSGLRFSSMNSSAPTNKTASYIGLDALGSVVKYPSPLMGSFTENKVSETAPLTFSVKGGQLYNAQGIMDYSNYVVVPNSTKSVLNAKIDDIYFVNYSFSADVIANTGASSYYECRIFIDDKPTTAVQTLQEYEAGGNVQFSLNYTTQLKSAGNHKFELRMMRVKNSGSLVNTSLVQFSNLSLVGGVSVLTFN